MAAASLQHHSEGMQVPHSVLLLSYYLKEGLGPSAEFPKHSPACALPVTQPHPPADSCTLIRALPLGTTGNEKPTTYTPRSSMAAAMRLASAASPNIMGCSSTKMHTHTAPSVVMRRPAVGKALAALASLTP